MPKELLSESMYRKMISFKDKPKSSEWKKRIDQKWIKSGEENLYKMILLFCKDRTQTIGSINKLLFFADALSYYHTGETISGQTYLKQPKGPAPKELEPILIYLTCTHLLSKREEIEFNKYQYYYKSVKVDWENIERQMSEENYQFVDIVKNVFESKSSIDLEDFIHRVEPWISSDWSIELDFKKILQDKTFCELLEDKFKNFKEVLDKLKQD